MKTKFLYIIIFSAALLGSVLITIVYSTAGKEGRSAALKNDLLITESALIYSTEGRNDVSFILGVDENQENPYYSEACDYYRYNRENRTRLVLTNLRSLVEVRDYLAENYPANGQPWGLINLISHGNQWTGLSATVTPESKRATAKRIIEYVNDGSFKELPDSIVDDKTEIFVHGCGIGNNTELLETISLAFGGTDCKPIVRASRLFEYYSSVRNNGELIGSERYLAKAWHIYYKKGYRPDDQELIDKLNRMYPEAGEDWKDALSRNEGRWSGDSYYDTFVIPIKWIVEYPDEDSIPDFSSEDKKLQWVRSQGGLMSELKETNLKEDQFNWWLRKIYVNKDDSSKCPAIWAKGFCTVLCVLKPLVDESKKNGVIHHPFLACLDDTLYYKMR